VLLAWETFRLREGSAQRESVILSTKKSMQLCNYMFVHLISMSYLVSSYLFKQKRMQLCHFILVSSYLDVLKHDFELCNLIPFTNLVVVVFVSCWGLSYFLCLAGEA
jgi:hypothetical protein